MITFSHFQVAEPAVQEGLQAESRGGGSVQCCGVRLISRPHREIRKVGRISHNVQALLHYASFHSRF